MQISPHVQQQIKKGGYWLQLHQLSYIHTCTRGTLVHDRQCQYILMICTNYFHNSYSSNLYRELYIYVGAYKDKGEGENNSRADGSHQI